jgi:hypothetical protein
VKSIKLTLILALFLCSAAQAQNSIRELQFIHLFQDISQSITAAKANMDQWEKKISCFNIGKLQALSIVVKSSTGKFLKSSNKNKRALRKLAIQNDKLTKFCTGKFETLSLKGLKLNFRLNNIRKVTDKIAKKLSEDFLDGENVKIGFRSAQQLFISSLDNLPEKFESIIYRTETEVDGHLYKPQVCIAVGRLFTSYQMFKLEASREKQFVAPLLQAEDSINNLRDLCFNKRGLNKYFREVEQIKEIIQE